MKATKKLNKIIVKLDLAKDMLIDELNDMIEKRNYVYNEKTERWKNGEYGERYKEETDKIEGVLREVENNFDWAFNELREFDNLKI